MQLSQLPAVREQQGLTVAELAQQAHLSPVTVRRLEAGQPARMSTALKLARALGLEWRTLVGDHPAPLREGRLRLRG